MSPRVLHAILCVLAMGWMDFAWASVRETRVDRGRSAGGKVGFRLLEASSTGLAFTNTLPESLAVQNLNLVNGSGVAAGDFDGDGRCDLYFCAINGTNALFRNLGGWRFEEVTTAAGVGCAGWHSTGAVFADIDGDGDLDLLVATLGSGVHCFRNEGQGRFREVTTEAGIASTAGSTTLALADIDGDGDLDLYVANYGALSVLRSGGRAEMKRVNDQWVITGPHAHRLRFVNGHVEEVGEAPVLYLNDGTGHFTAVPWDSPAFLDVNGRPKPAPLDYGLGVQMRDLNGDGAPEIYACNDFQSPDRLWLNDGKGHFREAPPRVVRKFPFSSMGVDFADVDRDGRLDFLVVEMASREHGRRMRQVTGAPPFESRPGDFLARPQVPRNAFYHGNDDGTWSEMAEYAGLASTDWSWQPVFLDVDLDGYEDLLVVNGMRWDIQDRDTLALIRGFGRQPPESARTNLLLYPPFASASAVYRNRGDLTFEDRSREWGFDAIGVAQGIALADLDGDGDLDVAVNCLNGGALLFRNEGTAPVLGVRLNGRPPNTHGVGGRIRVGGGPVRQQQEIVAGGRYLSGDDTMRTFAGGSAESFTIEVLWRSGLRTVVNNARPNHVYEIGEAGETNGPPGTVRKPAPWFEESAALKHVHHEEPFDDFARQPLLARRLSSLGPGVAWCDFDGDGRVELVVGTGRGGKLGGYRFDAAGRAVPLGSEWIAPDDVTGFTAWTTGEGRPALLAAVATYEAGITGSPLVQITLDRGGNNLVVTPLAGIAASMSSIGPLAAADYDGDGDLDLFVGGRVLPGAYPLRASSHVYRRQDGALVEDEAARLLLGQAGLVSGAVWSDLDGDGYPELILACEWGPVRIFRNDHGRLGIWDPEVSLGKLGGREDSVALSKLTGWWTSVTTGDFDGDGRLDVVLGNWGLNTGSTADPVHPLRLYHGDLGGTGMVDLFEAYFPAGTEVERPLRNLNALGQAFPILAERFSSHRVFGEATAADVLKTFKGKVAVVAAVELRSLLLINRIGGLEARALPREAQLAPVFGLAVGDVDGDGNEDLFVAQNFFANRVEWPRTEAGRGQWLRGDGRGGWVVWPGSESGVVLEGEQRGAALADVDGDGRLDLVVAQNGAGTRLWMNRGGKPGVRVRLRGPKGNPEGIGARIWLRHGEGPVMSHEVRAGGGYWSQEGATAVFGGDRLPTEVEVRWPGGKTDRHPWPRGAREVLVGSAGEVEGR